MKAMNILQHIEAGHYPTDEKGHALVPTTHEAGALFRVYSTDHSEEVPIVGAFIGNFGKPQHYPQTVYADGRGCSMTINLLPPPPRKVKARGWVIVNTRTGNIRPTAYSSYIDANTSSMSREEIVVRLEGEYEVTP